MFPLSPVAEVMIHTREI